MPCKDPIRRKEIARKYRENNREKCREANRIWRENNPDVKNRWYYNNLEKCREKNKLWYQNNRERHHELSRKWYNNNREYHRQKAKRWNTKIENKYRVCKKDHEKRYGVFTTSLEDYIKAYTSKNCIICGREVGSRRFWENDFRGFAHPHCNTVKSSMNMLEFQQFISDIYERVYPVLLRPDAS